MKLSAIIINQDMCKPLRNALSALQKAALNLDMEMIVVDNASADRSVAMLETEFPEVNLMVNDRDLGFAKSVNQAMENASGDYVLIMHPSIINSEETLDKVLHFMDLHPHVGGLSVRMLDAEGHFIPESKKGMPAAWINFFSFTGLARLFSKSRLFSPHYEAGWVEEFENTETDVLNGCFMLLRKAALNVTGLFDERFPVYGYDIDLSYRMRLEGFRNYYFAKTFVIQQQVMQPSKVSWHHLRNFYGAMFTFAAKYLLKMPELRLKAMPRWSSSAV
ncbi:glycosyltransferase [Mucilaginibacter sp. CSA2-8R]|uniref:glycosyltransferase n=1 Tax=Mucilaginibacter sp. CSA2-8R TaxID=3141542 RepID=UPI00315C5DE4